MATVKMCMQNTEPFLFSLFKGEVVKYFEYIKGMIC